MSDQLIGDASGMSYRTYVLEDVLSAGSMRSGGHSTSCDVCIRHPVPGRPDYSQGRAGSGAPACSKSASQGVLLWDRRRRSRRHRRSLAGYRKRRTSPSPSSGEGDAERPERCASSACVADQRTAHGSPLSTDSRTAARRPFGARLYSIPRGITLTPPSLTVRFFPAITSVALPERT